MRLYTHSEEVEIRVLEETIALLDRSMEKAIEQMRAAGWPDQMEDAAYASGKHDALEAVKRSLERDIEDIRDVAREDAGLA